MTATALVSGRLQRDPERKVSKAGKPYVAATIREGDGETVTWWSVLCFSESAGAELMEMRAGEGVAASGSFRVEPFLKDGETKLAFTLFADGVLSARRRKREKDRERRAEAKATDRAAPALDPWPDDRVPF